MPFLIPFIPAMVGVTGAALAAVTIALTVVEMAAMFLISKMLAPSPQGSQLSNGSTEEYSGTVEPRRIIYGTNLIAGMNAIPPWCHGTNNEMLDQVLVIAGHEIDGYGALYANQEYIAPSSIGGVAYTLNDGLVTTGTFANHLWVRRYTGAATDQVDTILYNAWPASWNTMHQGIGIAKLCIQYQFDATVYSGGKAQIRVIVRGKKVYDPRLDITPGANPSNPSYMLFSSNSALCAVDYIIDPVLGIGEDATRINWPAAVAAANICDELVVVPTLLATTPLYDAAHYYNVGDSVQSGGVVYACTVATINHAPPNGIYWAPQAAGQTQQRRYNCNTVLDCTQSYENNLKTISAAFQGAVLYSSGQWILLPGHWQTPTFSIGDDDVAGAFDFHTAVPFANRFNAVRGQYYDPANLYQPTEYPAIRVSADEVADGEGPVWRELQQAHCTDIFEAQRNAIILQRKSRRKKSWSFPANYGMYGIRPGDFGQLTISELGIYLQYVRCMGWKMDGKAMTVMLTLEEVDPTDWNDPAPGVYQTATALATPAPANFISSPVTALTATGGNGGITFKWTMPVIWHSNLSVELWESTTNNFAYATLAWAGVNTGAFLMKADTIVRYYWVLVRNFAGNTTSTTNPLSPFNGLSANSLTTGVGPAGPPGQGGLVGSLTLQDMVFPATSAGHVTSYAGGSGQFQVYVGTLDVTAVCTFSIAPAGNLSGLTYTLTGETFSSQTATGQTETINAAGFMVFAGTGIVVTAQSGQGVTGTGSTAFSPHFDATNVRFDTTATRWDRRAGSIAPPTTGTGATSE